MAVLDNADVPLQSEAYYASLCAENWKAGEHVERNVKDSRAFYVDFLQVQEPQNSVTEWKIDELQDSLKIKELIAEIPSLREELEKQKINQTKSLEEIGALLIAIRSREVLEFFEKNKDIFERVDVRSYTKEDLKNVIAGSGRSHNWHKNKIYLPFLVCNYRCKDIATFTRKFKDEEFDDFFGTMTNFGYDKTESYRIFVYNPSPLQNKWKKWEKTKNKAVVDGDPVTVLAVQDKKPTVWGDGDTPYWKWPITYAMKEGFKYREEPAGNNKKLKVDIDSLEFHHDRLACEIAMLTFNLDEDVLFFGRWHLMIYKKEFPHQCSFLGGKKKLTRIDFNFLSSDSTVLFTGRIPKNELKALRFRIELLEDIKRSLEKRFDIPEEKFLYDPEKQYVRSLEPIIKGGEIIGEPMDYNTMRKDPDAKKVHYFQFMPYSRLVYYQKMKYERTFVFYPVVGPFWCMTKDEVEEKIEEAAEENEVSTADKTPIEEKPEEAAELKGKEVTDEKKIEISGGTAIIYVWDHRYYDHDIVDVYVNGQLFAKNLELTKEKFKIIVNLIPGYDNNVKFVVKSKGLAGGCTIQAEVEVDGIRIGDSFTMEADLEKAMKIDLQSK